MGVLVIIIIALLKFIGYLLLILLGLLLLLLILPFSYNLRLEFEEDLCGEIRVGWPWGMIGIESELGADRSSFLCFFGRWRFKLKKHEALKKKGKEKKEKPKESIEETDEKSGKSIFTIHYIKELIDMGILHDLLEILEQLIRWILPKEIRTRVKIGFDDPSYTGTLYGAYASVPILRARWNIFLEPNFTEEEFEIDARIKGRVILFQILFLAIKLLLKKSVRKIIKDRRRSKKDGKEKLSK